MSTNTPVLQESIIPYSQLNARLPELRKEYLAGDPFPHIVLDNFLCPEAIEKALAEFPAIKSGSWIQYHHFNERKYGKNKIDEFGANIASVVRELNSDTFVKFLRDLTGIEGLFADESLEGGGLHQSTTGGYLNIHADFNSHPHQAYWRRRINVLVYLNKDWKDQYKGHLELWDRKMKGCVKKILPVFNRAVIFNTTEDSFHGHPEPLECPRFMTRKSIALYYFTKEARPVGIASTQYRPRPGDGVRKIAVYVDGYIVNFYDRIKRWLGINDDFVNGILKRVADYRVKQDAIKRARRIRQQKQS